MFRHSAWAELPWEPGHLVGTRLKGGGRGTGRTKKDGGSLVFWSLGRKAIVVDGGPLLRQVEWEAAQNTWGAERVGAAVSTAPALGSGQ